MDSEHFGTFLKERREARGLTLADISRATKIQEQSLALLERAQLEDLPAMVFVKGYVTAYARHVGANETEALRRLHAHLASYQAEKRGSGFARSRHRGAATEGAGRNSAESTGQTVAMFRQRLSIPILLTLLALVLAMLTLWQLRRRERAPGLLPSPASERPPTNGR